MKIESQKKLNLDNIQALRNTLYPMELSTLGEGYYDAIVTRCIDKKNPGWIRVSILGLTDSLPVLDQPWAEPAPGQGNIIPEPGAYVSVTFKGGDIHFPVWHSAGIQGNGKFLTKESLEEYPHNNVMYKHKDGTIVHHNTKSGDLVIANGEGTSIVIDKNNKVTISAPDAINPLVRQYPVATGAVICPYLASLAAASGGATSANIFHPTNNPNLLVDDTIAA